MSVTISQEEARKLELLKNLSPDEERLFLDALARHADHSAARTGDQSIDQLLARHYSPGERTRLELESLAKAFTHRREILAGAVTASEVAALLGTSRQTPHDRVRARTLLAVMDNGALRFPLWQFDPQGSDGVLAGLTQVLKSLQVSDFAKAAWFMRPNPLLDGLTPAEALRHGMLERVLADAMVVGHGQN